MGQSKGSRPMELQERPIGSAGWAGRTSRRKRPSGRFWKWETTVRKSRGQGVLGGEGVDEATETEPAWDK